MIGVNRRACDHGFNILVGTSAFVADGRLLNPDVMALLNTSFLERWRKDLSIADSSRGQLRAIEVVNTAMPEAMPVSEDETATLVAWYDFDVDRDFDVLAIRGTKLRITPRDAAQQNTLQVELPFAPNGHLIADLWTVDSPQRPMLKSTAGATAGATDDASAPKIDGIVMTLFKRFCCGTIAKLWLCLPIPPVHNWDW